MQGQRPVSDALAERLTQAVSDALDTEATVVLEGSASVGATRRTFFGSLRLAVEGSESVQRVVIQLAGMNLDSLPFEVEAELVSRAGAEGVAVAEPIVSCDQSSPVGAPFQIVKRVDGLTVPRRILRAVDDNPSLGSLLTRQCAQALGRLHTMEPSALPARMPTLTDPTPAKAYVAHLEAIAEDLPASPVVSLGLRWLRLNEPPPPDRPAIVHSDMRNGNLIIDPEPSADPVGLAAVIDWELAHVGDPMEDLAWLCLRCWRFGNDDAVVGGFGDLEGLVADYEASGARFRPEAFEWWSVARTLWWCLILTLQASAFTSGLSDSLVLAASGRRVCELEHDLLVLIDPTRRR